jgi:hypothetical protein
VSTPRVTDEPVFLAIFYSIAYHFDIVDGVNVTSSITVDSSFVFFERIGNCNFTSDRSSLDDLLFHWLFSFNSTEFVNSINLIFRRDEASLVRVAISAHFHRGARLSIVMTTSLVDRASSVSDFVFAHPFES